MCKLELQSDADTDRLIPIETYQMLSLKRIKLLYQQNVEKSLFKTDSDLNYEHEEDNVASLSARAETSILLRGLFGYVGLINLLSAGSR